MCILEIGLDSCIACWLVNIYVINYLIYYLDTKQIIGKTVLWEVDIRIWLKLSCDKVWFWGDRIDTSRKEKAWHFKQLKTYLSLHISVYL